MSWPAQALDFDAELRRLNQQVDQSKALVARNDQASQSNENQILRRPSAAHQPEEPEESFEVKLIAKPSQRR
ncbi:MAG: hypothetical protein IT288_02750 [Bdellovibrionales bacterium]|nr:hypothetical protein [Bdellovibrionales bacterium]